MLIKRQCFHTPALHCYCDTTAYIFHTELLSCQISSPIFIAPYPSIFGAHMEPYIRVILFLSRARHDYVLPRGDTKRTDLLGRYSAFSGEECVKHCYAVWTQRRHFTFSLPVPTAAMKQMVTLVDNVNTISCIDGYKMMSPGKNHGTTIQQPRRGYVTRTLHLLFLRRIPGKDDSW